MTDTTAAFCDVTSFDGRIFSLGDYRRVFRSIGDGIVIGLGTVATACLLVGTVTVAAAWIVNIVLATNPHIHAQTPMGPGALALVRYGPSLAAVPDTFPPALVSTAAADVPDATFESRWARVTPAAPARIMAIALSPPSETPQSAAKPETAHSMPLPRPHPARYEIVRAPVVEPQTQVAVAAPPPTFTPEKRVTPQPAHNKGTALPDPDSRTAVYDISARTVYLPSGKKLEAHSGLGDKLDDPRYVHVRMRGPTPPNVYELSLREKLFHGVRAIRLNPVDDSKMFGRDGMLAHTYMLGPNGQSNGCVSFKDYRAFLNAYLRGEVDRLVVVSHLGDARPRTARAPRGHVRRYASTEQTVEPSTTAW